jgi:hypothetical protein
MPIVWTIIACVYTVDIWASYKEYPIVMSAVNQTPNFKEGICHKDWQNPAALGLWFPDPFLYAAMAFSPRPQWKHLSGGVVSLCSVFT